MFSFFLPKAQPDVENPESVTKTEGTLDFLWELMKVVIISLAIILPVRYFLVQPFYVNGASMEPTYFERDYLIVDELSYRFEEPKRGDVVIFKCSSPACGASRGSHLIKRVIALPGEHVELQKGIIFIQNREHPEGFFLDERPYLTRGIYEHDTLAMDLGNDEYFVMGDNRCVSFASEDFGPIKRSWLVGRAWIRGWPFTTAGFINGQTYTPLLPLSDTSVLRRINCLDYYN